MDDQLHAGRPLTNGVQLVNLDKGHPLILLSSVSKVYEYRMIIINYFNILY